MQVLQFKGKTAIEVMTARYDIGSPGKFHPAEDKKIDAEAFPQKG